MESPNSDYQAAFQIGLAQESVDVVGPRQIIILPEGCNAYDPQGFLENPRRASRNLDFDDSDSFIAYVERHKAASTQIMAGSDASSWSISVIFDHHRKDVPGWCSHKARFSPPISRQWQEWAKIDRRPMNQQDFADFIEDHLPDIYDPDEADLLSMCLTFTRSAQSEFTQNRRLEDGSYSVTVSDEGDAKGMNTAGQKVTVPDRIGLSMPIFKYESNGADPNLTQVPSPSFMASMRARLRTRVADGKLTFTIRLQQADETLELAQQALIDKIATATGIKVYRGSAL